jgi:hypothetical protein
MRWLAILISAAIGIWAASAQESLVRFSTDQRDVVPAEMLDGKVNLDLRPNIAHRLHLFVRNPSEEIRDMTVRLRDTAGKQWTDAVVKDVPKGHYARVRFKPPPPPMPAPAATAPMPPMPAPETPTGVELNAVENAATKKRVREFEVIVSYVDNLKKTIEQKTTVLVDIRAAADYVTVAGVRFSKDGRKNGLQVELATKEDFNPPCTVELKFPPQPNLRADALRSGDYLRILKSKTPPTKEDALRADLSANNLPILPGAKESGTVYVNIDGVPRAFIYKPAFHVENPKGGVVPALDTAGIHIVEPGRDRSIMPILSLPKEQLSIRVEVDRAPAGANIELQLDRGTGVLSADDLHARHGTRHERVWIDPFAPDDVFLVTTRVTDWAITLDTRGMRGVYTLKAIVNVQDGNRMVARATSSRGFILDDTPPEEVSIDKLPEKHVRTLPLPVHIFAGDPESGVTKVAVFLGKPGPDGKLPEGAVLIEAQKPTAEGGAWIAQVPLAADKKGTIDLSAVATNGVGLTSTQVQKVQLLDPPTGGTIKGSVTLGGRPQPGAKVSLKDGEGKEKDFATTDAKGSFTMNNVLPGAYKVFASRTDAGVGTKGEEAVKVEAGKEHKVEVKISRRPVPETPPKN